MEGRGLWEMEPQFPREEGAMSRLGGRGDVAFIGDGREILLCCRVKLKDFFLKVLQQTSRKDHKAEAFC